MSAGIGIITNFDDPENPTSTIVNFPAVVAKTPSYLTTSNITYVAINSSGTVTESATPFTPEQRRTLIILGAVIHSNLTNINVVNNISAPTNASTNQLHDLMEAIGALNLSGNKFGPNNANLLMNKSAGTIFKLGSNFVNDWKNPHVLGQGALTGLTFRYRTQNGTEGADVTSINPNVYDLNNVLTAVPSNRYSIQTITLFQSGLVRVQYGQETYGSLSEAEAAISTRSYAVESNIALNGITRAYLLVKEGSTSLTNTANAKFVDAGKFGSITSGGGAITLASIIAALGYTPENDANKQNSLATDGSGVKYPTVDAVNTKVSNIDNTSDLNKPISTATQTALNLKENTANKNTANGYAGLGSDGKLISSQLPSITITDTFVVGSQSAMLSLVAETGDVAVRTDVNKSFILQGDTPSDIADWQELLTPTSTVTSVFGRTGAVTSNVGDYTADQISETASRKFQTLAQQTYNDATSSIQTQLNGKQTTLTNPITGSTLLSGNAGTGYVPRATASTTLTNSNIYDNGTNIGIGTTTPSALLQVKGESPLTANTRYLKAQIGGGNSWGSNSFEELGVGFGGIRSTYVGGDNWDMSFATGTSTGFGNGTQSERMRIASNGRVGIGTSTPVTNLQVAGESSTASFRLSPSAGTYENYRLDIKTEASEIGALKMSLNDNTFLKTYGYYFLSGLSLGVAGNEDLLHLNSGNKVGIGTTSPAYKLEVSGTTDGVIGIRNTTNNSFRGLSFLDGSGATEYSYIKYNANTGEMRHWSNPAGFGGYTTFYSNAAESMRITANGSIGIGTQNPDGKLNVYTGASVTNATAFNAGDGSNSIKYIPYTSAGAYNDLSVVGGGLLLGNINSKLTIGTWNGTGIQFGPTNTLINGNVGISTSAPTSKLQVSQGSQSNTVSVANSSSFLYGTDVGLAIGQDNGAGAYGTWVQSMRTDNTSFGLSLNPNGGDVTVGGLTPTGYKFTVKGGQYGTLIQGGDLGTGSEIVKFSKADTSLAMFIRGDGNVGIANASPSEKLTIGGNVLAAGFFQSSDLRLKDIISRDGDVIKYKWKDKRDDKIHIGYVAQEVQKENPDQVNADDKGILSVNYIEILVQKIKDLENRIKQLEK